MTKGSKRLGWLLASLLIVPSIYFLNFYINLKIGRSSFSPLSPAETKFTGPRLPGKNKHTANFTSNSDLVPHRVYFDRRPQSSHSNATVVSISVLLKYRDKIVGCDVDGVVYKNPSVSDIVLRNFIARYRRVSHVDCFVYCFDMDVVVDSVVSILYEKNGTIVSVPALTDVVIPDYETEEDGVMVCATGFGEVPYLGQWLTYQKTVGIKFIHINANPSFLANFNSSVELRNYSKNGYVSVESWELRLDNKQVFYHSQSLKYQDCVLRYQGRYKYVMVIDFDEYFVPFDQAKDVLSYARKFIKGNIGTIILPRQDYFCMLKGAKDGPMPSDGNLTRLYSTARSTHPHEGKSIHLMKAVRQNSVHRVGEVFPPYNILNYRDSPKSAHCRLAHLSIFPPPPKKRCRYN